GPRGGEEGAGGELEPLQPALRDQNDLGDQPVAAVAVDGAVDRQHGSGVARGPEEHDADLGLVEAKVEESVVELPPGGDRPGARAGLEETGGSPPLSAIRRLGGERRGPPLAVDPGPHPAAFDAGLRRARRERLEWDARTGRGPVARRDEGRRPFPDP